jgi:hypothetical protein
MIRAICRSPIDPPGPKILPPPKITASAPAEKRPRAVSVAVGFSAGLVAVLLGSLVWSFIERNPRLLTAVFVLCAVCHAWVAGYYKGARDERARSPLAGSQP